MNPNIRLKYSGFSIAVLGLGRSGTAAATLLGRMGVKVTAFDDNPVAGDDFRGVNISLRLGSDAVAMARPDDFEMAVLSPGLDPATPLVQGFLRAGVPVISELEFASSLDPTPAVAITGTNGKTTTTELTAAALAGAGVATATAGNIGRPWSELILDGIACDVITLEVSSFQLERITTFRPRVAVWTNFTPDHLDRYPDLESYRAAKLRIFEFQTPEDHVVLNARETLPLLAAQKLTFSAHQGNADFTLDGSAIAFRGRPLLSMDELQLVGRHNAENVMCVLGIAHALSLPFDGVLPALRAYRPQAHRCEFLGEAGGIRWVNDSKATNLDAVAQALRALAGPVVLIAGGKEKGFSFAPLAALVAERARQVILIGETSARIAQEWGKHVPCELAERSLRRAVELAVAQAQPGDTILLAPGTSSFDMFKNYADRGDQFRALACEHMAAGSSAKRSHSSSEG